MSGEQIQRITKAWQWINGQAIPINLGGTDDAPNIPFGTCTTNASEQVKVVSDVADFSLEDNARVVVKFTKTNTASSPQLNVMSSGAKNILYKNAAVASDVFTAGHVYEFLFDEVADAYQLLGGVDTNDAVEQSEINANSGAVPLLLAPTAAPNGAKTGVKYSAGATFNPSTSTLNATNFSGTANKATKDASGNTITDTYATKTEVSEGYLAKTGTAVKATADASGNNIENTYATKSELSGYVTTSGTAYGATRDGSGNTITSTYATKTELAGVHQINYVFLESNEDLPVSGVNYTVYFKPLSDSTTGNMYEEFFWTGSAYEKLGSRSIDLSGYLTTSGTAAKATADADGNVITTTYATKSELSGYVTTTGTAAKATADASGNTITTTYATKTELANATAPKATKLETTRYIDGISFDGSANVNHYYTCTTGASTQAKTVSNVTGFSLVAGARICLKFSYTNTASAPKLNVNSTGAKTIYQNGASIDAGLLVGGGVYEFMYDGTNWNLLGAGSGGSSDAYPLSSYLKTATFGSNGFPSRYTMQDNSYCDFTWDSQNRLHTVYESDTGRTQTLTYDSYGRLASITLS